MAESPFAPHSLHSLAKHHDCVQARADVEDADFPACACEACWSADLPHAWGTAAAFVGCRRRCGGGTVLGPDGWRSAVSIRMDAVYAEVLSACNRGRGLVPLLSERRPGHADLQCRRFLAADLGAPHSV